MEVIRRILEVVGTKPVPSYSTGPMLIPGTVAAAAAAGDALGTQWRVRCPKNSILQSAAYYDLSFLKAQVNVVVSREPFTIQIADNAAFDLPAGDELKVLYELQFVAFSTHVTSAISFIDQIGRVLRFPRGECYLQAWMPAAFTPVAAKLPFISLDFLPDEEIFP